LQPGRFNIIKNGTLKILAQQKTKFAIPSQQLNLTFELEIRGIWYKE
jgi:hypothetical protein